MKKFLIKISYTVLPVWLFFVGLAIYLVATGDNSGDLMRLGLIDGGAEYTDSICTGLLPEVYYTNLDNDSILQQDTCGIVVVGDSFSHGGGVGKAGDYVNYLANESGRRVIVFSPGEARTMSPVQVAYDLLNLGVIDSSRVRNLVVEEVERYLVDRHCGFVTNHTSLPRPVPIDTASLAAPKPKVDSSPLLRVKDYIFYRFFGANPICKVQLDKDFFGGTDPRTLYFYNEDVKMGYDVSAEQRGKIVDCYDKLIAAARERGVNLVILVACDKYDLYQSHIVDNPYPAKSLNEDVATWMAHDIGHFVFAKQVLSPLVEQGTKDVFLFNDTHWSPSSSRVVAGEIIQKLK